MCPARRLAGIDPSFNHPIRRNSVEPSAVLAGFSAADCGIGPEGSDA
jgi:hypothetical protein